MAEQWLSIVEYARKFSLSDMTVRRRIKNGRINAVLKDGKYYIPASAVPPRHQSTDEEKEAPPRDNGAESRDRRFNQAPHHSPSTPMQVVKTQRPQGTELSYDKTVYEKRDWNVGETTTTSQAQYVGASAHAAPQAPSRAFDQRGHEILTSRMDALAASCDKAVQELKKAETALAQKYEAKIRALESELRGKDRELKELLQQNEDLKLLLKFVEKKTK